MDIDSKEIEHLIGMLTDVGGGDLRAGIEIARENHKWLKGMRDNSCKAASIAFILVVTALVTGILSTLWSGLKGLLHG